MFLAFFFLSLVLLGALAFWGFQQWQENTAREEREERARANQRELFTQSAKGTVGEAPERGREAGFGRR